MKRKYGDERNKIKGPQRSKHQIQKVLHYPTFHTFSATNLRQVGLEKKRRNLEQWSQSVFPIPAAWPGNLLEMQIPGPLPDLLSQKLWG